jgi:glycosyltransferase involved in cell wall biosynthesis
MRVRSATIITPCRNAERLVRRTLESILAQTAVRSGRLRLQYLVCDGASTDGTLAVVREVCGGAAQILSEPDRSMYDALAKGLGRATGDFVGYLNAGDTYAPAALEVVADVLEAGAARWVAGRVVTQDEQGRVLVDLLPFRYRRELIRAGLYGSRVLPFFVPQEATFFARELLAGVDLEELRALRLAGDHYLWSRFAREADLVVVDATLGVFTVHPGQQSEDRAGYRREVERVSDRPRPVDLARAMVERLLWHAPPSWKRRLVGGGPAARPRAPGRG